MCVYIYICIYVYICKYITMYVYIYIYIYVSIYIYIYIYIQIYMYIQATSTKNCVNIYIYAFMYTYIYIYLYMLYICIYMYVQGCIYFFECVRCTVFGKHCDCNAHTCTHLKRLPLLANHLLLLSHCVLTQHEGQKKIQKHMTDSGDRIGNTRAF